MSTPPRNLVDACPDTVAISGPASERSLIAEAPKTSASLFQAVWENSADGMRVTDEEGNIVAVNDAFCTLTRFNPRQLIGKPFTTIYSECEPVTEMLAEYRRCFPPHALQRHVERTLRLHDGRVVDLSVTNSFIELTGQRPLLLSVFRDITPRKTAERSLLKSEGKMRLIWENALDGMRLINADGIIVMVNDAYCRIVGKSRTELEGQPLYVVYGEHEPWRIQEDHRQRFAQRCTPPHIETGARLWNGRQVFLTVYNAYLEVADQPPLLLSTFRDITEAKLAERALYKSESQMRLMWETALDGMRLIDAQGVIVMVNASYCRMVGRSREALEGHLLTTVYDPDSADRVQHDHRERFQQRSIPPHHETEVTLWDGRRMFLELSNSFLDLPDQPSLLLSTFRDITEGKRAQSRIHGLEQQRALERERERIARDMHDELGGSLTRITLLSEIAESAMRETALNPGDETRARLQKISTIARSVVCNLDEIVWAVDPGNDSLEKFASYICHCAEETFKLTPVVCRLDVPALLPNLFIGSEARHHLFLAVKESLNNVLKHAHATEAGLQLTIQERALGIRITDNGCGFDTAAEQQFANGRANMTRRLAEIGGLCLVESAPGRGTVVTLEFELPHKS